MNGLFGKFSRQQNQLKKPMINLLSPAERPDRVLPPSKRIEPRGALCPKEMNRWLGRWENEGGAIVGDRTRKKTISERNARKENTTRARATNKIMKRTNHNEEMIRYGDPLRASSRRRRGGYQVMTYNDRSPEVAAMNAHLRASSYPEKANEKRYNGRARLTSSKMRLRNSVRTFLHLSDQYDAQARDNFIKEAVLFVVIVAAAAWPIYESVKAIIASW